MESNKSWFLPDYREFADKVVEFNFIADNGILNRSPEKITLQKKLIQEEYEEVVEAYEKRDKVEFLKELCDLFVVTSYMLRITKPEEYEREDTFILDNRFGAPPFYSAFNLISDMIYIEDWRSVIKAVIGILRCVDAKEREALYLVNDNNFSKFCWYQDSQEDVYDHMAQAISTSSNGRYTNVSWYKVNNWVIFKDEDGKIMKPVGYLPVNLKTCLKDLNV